MIKRVTILLIPLLFLFCSLGTDAKKFTDDNEEQRQWQEFQEFLDWKRSKALTDESENKNHHHHHNAGTAIKFESHSRGGKSYDKQEQNPPPIDEAALMARYIVNQADWSSVATISSRKEIQSFPYVNVISVSDGALGNGSGIPYMYLTPLDFTAQDLAKDSRATLLMTLAQGDYCKEKMYDPMDPRCARITLTGKIKPLKNNTSELEVAKKAVFERHSWLAHMPENHRFFFAKLKISSIVLLDTFGGPKYISIKDYLHPPTNNVTEEFFRHFADKISDDWRESRKIDNSDLLKYLQPTVRVM